jgi:mevalonate kinase
LLRPFDDRAREAYLAAAREAGVDPGRFAPAVTSRLPVGQGLGSSAAFSVAASRALLAAAGRQAPDAEVLRLAGAMEKVFHGSPSGMDATMALGRGPVIFRKGASPESLSPGRPLAVIVILSGTSPSTRTMVEDVRRRCEEDPATLGGLMDAEDGLVGEAIEAIGTGALAKLGRAMNENHDALRAMGVSTPVLDRLVAKARAAGALGAKLTGGGGGGAVIALAASAAHAGEIRKKLNMGKNSFITIIRKPRG